MTIEIIEAILALDKDAQVVVRGVPSNESEYKDQVKIIVGSAWTWEQVSAKQAELQAEYDAQEYARSRKVEYPSIEECVHAILDDQLDALQVKRQAVKAKYPKP